MENKDLLSRLKVINTQALGTYNGSIIKLVQQLCDIIYDLATEDNKGCTHCVDVPVQEVSKDVSSDNNNCTVSGPKLSGAKPQATKNAKKGSARKAKMDTGG